MYKQVPTHPRGRGPINNKGVSARQIVLTMVLLFLVGEFFLLRQLRSGESESTEETNRLLRKEQDLSNVLDQLKHAQQRVENLQKANYAEPVNFAEQENSENHGNERKKDEAKKQTENLLTPDTASGKKQNQHGPGNKNNGKQQDMKDPSETDKFKGLNLTGWEQYISMVVVGEGKGNGSLSEIPAGWAQQDWSDVTKATNNDNNNKNNNSPQQQPVVQKTEEELGQLSMDKYAFNAYLSSKTPLRRRQPDKRDPSCAAAEAAGAYDTQALPATSVVIIFADEVWSVLVRTVWSVLDATPEHLLESIILVDDGCTAEWLHEDLTAYMANFPPKVKLIRLSERLGLIRARTIGADASSSAVITFLDAHCECQPSWYEPLASRILQDPRVVPTPVIDVLSARDLSYATTVDYSVGIFRWTMDFAWEVVADPSSRNMSAASPWPSPTMAGGLLAIARETWQDFGKYDLGMQGWGGENLEMSFRIWQCGGRIEVIPCARVGHLFRAFHPYSVPSGVGNTFARNTLRMINVWMDEYKEAAVKFRNGWTRMDYGDISQMEKLRKDLHCKSFKWYMETLMPDMFVPLHTQVEAEGSLKERRTQRCFEESKGKAEPVLAAFCKSRADAFGTFFYTKKNHLRTLGKCLRRQLGDSNSVVLMDCLEKDPNLDLQWLFNADSGEIRYLGSPGPNGEQCLHYHENGGALTLTLCDQTSDAWELSKLKV